MDVRVPMDLIVERMAYLYPQVRLENPAAWVRGVKLLPGQWEGISADYLYLCRAEDDFPLDSPAAIAVACPGQPPEQLPRSHILLRAPVPLADIFNELLGLQLLLQDWDLKLSLSVSEGRGIQHLLDLSEPVLGNPIVVADPACKCLAVTTSFESDDPLFSQWLTQGYLSEENFNILKQSEVYMSDELYSGKTLVLPVSPVKPYVTTFTPVLSEDRTRVRYEISMEFCNVPYSDGLFQLYCYLVDKLLIYLCREDEETAALRDRYDYFLLDVLEERCATRQELEERSRCFLGADCAGRNVVVVWQGENTEMYRKHAIFTLRTLFPQTQPVLYRDMFVLLPRLGVPRQGLEPGAAGILEGLEEFLAAEDAFAGISNPLRSCHDLAGAFRGQALQALELGRRLREVSERELGRAFWYADHHLSRMIEAARERVPEGELVNGALIDIVRYDRAHRTSYRNTLCAYLRRERSFTDTAAELHLHRNTVIYQIRRIEEIFGLNLDDHELRLQLLMSDRVLEMYPQAAGLEEPEL